jgi:HlyD family secretion protein
VKRAASTSLWSRGALGFAVLAAFNAVLLVYAWIHFALAHPQYFESEWPTFSRALSMQTLLYPVLAAVAGTGLFIGASSLAAMQLKRARLASTGRGALLGMALAGAVAAPLGIVHYFHVSVTLSADNDTHMALSYLFFFGMSFVIGLDLVCSKRARRAGVFDAATISERHLRSHQRVGYAVIAGAGVFLLTFFLKDAAWNPWAGAAQKSFVCAEAAWIVCAHLYALFYVAPIRAYFAVPMGASARSRAYVRSMLLIAALTGAAAYPDAPARAAEPAAAIGGTGRIQPAGGVIVVAAPAGRGVEQVLVKEGERVKKGALLLTLADQSVRTLERDLAAERLRNAERQAIERRKSAELELQTAKLTHSHASADAAAVAQLDERTFPAREKRLRDNAVAQAKVALEAATVKLDEARKAADAELRLARTQLKLAEAALVATRVTAPADATVLEVHVQPGASGGGPALTLADTSRMYVVADFFEGDLPKLAAGQRAKIANNALGQTLEGAIERIGRVIDPVNRLAKVWVRLDKPQPADRFIGMQVDVKVDLARGTAPAARADPAASRGPAVKADSASSRSPPLKADPSAPRS